MDEERIKQIIAELLGKASIAKGVQGGSLLSGLDTPEDREGSFIEGILGAGPWLKKQFDEYGKASRDAAQVIDDFLPGAVTTNTGEEYQTDIGKTLATRDAAQAATGGLLPGTPAYRDYMMNMGQGMGNEYTLGIDGKDYGYNFTGDGLGEVGMAQFRDRNNITANTGGGSDNLGFGQYQTDLQSDFTGGFASPTNPQGLETPALRHSIGEIMANLDPQEQQKVQMILQSMNQEQQKVFINGMMNGNIDAGGYEVQNQYRLGY
jgi:hypothetical protein